MANTKITTNVIADDAVTSDKLGGDLTMPGHVSLADSGELRLGTGNDLVIKHNGSNASIINGTGHLTLRGATVYIADQANNEYMAQFIANGAASLRYDNTEELVTVSGGVYVPNKLGIGTNSASSELHVKGSGEVQVYIDAATNNNPGVRFLENGANKWTIGNDNTNDGFFFYDFGASAERMRIDSTGRVLIGTTASRLTSGVTPNFVIEGTSYNTNSIGVFTNANGVLDCPLLFFGKSRGTSDGSNTIVQNGDRLFSMRIDGSDGTNLEQAAIIEAYVDGTPANNSIPGRMTFMTTNSGSQYATEKMRIDSAGVVSIGASQEAKMWISSGDRFNLATADGLGIQLDKDNNRIAPIDASATPSYNNNVSLGSSSLPFKDLHIDRIYFNQSHNSGMTSDALSEYEEGTFTPFITTAGGNYTSGSQSPLGYYTKIGRYVHILLEVSISSSPAISGGSGDFMITGLPYDPIIAAVGNCSTGRVDKPTYGTWQAYIGQGNTTVKLRAISNYPTDSDGIEVAQASVIHGNTTPWFSITIAYQV